jgi:putative holliday junction resolvase
MAIVQYISALALDVGSKRIGVAGCDGTGLIATGIMTIDRTSFEQVVEIIQKLISDRSVSILVVGLPYTLAGEMGAQAKQVQKFTRRLAKIIELPVEYVDERLTSVTAEQLMIAAGQSPRDDKGMIDRMAAALILQDWLNLRRAQLDSST